MQLTDDFLFDSKFISINGNKIHYVDEGSGDPILFIHGNPTSSYLWRNIIPFLSQDARCIALDLIGFGKSDKPNIDYRFVTHADYLEKFISALRLKNITLVLHDWGSALGFNYGLSHLTQIKGFAFIEAGNFFKPIDDMCDFDPSQSQALFGILRDPIKGPKYVKDNFPFLSDMKQKILGRELSHKAQTYYETPFLDPESRKPIWIFPTQFPIAGNPKEVFNIFSEYSKGLQTCNTPKLLFYATPGANTPIKKVNWARKHLKNLKTVNIGSGTHYLLEDNPIKIGQELLSWYKTLENNERIAKS